MLQSEPPKTRLLISASGVVVAVHDDLVQELGNTLGDMRIDRASDVEWDGQQWIAKELKTGSVIASGLIRRKVLQDERTVLENKLVDYVP